MYVTGGEGGGGQKKNPSAVFYQFYMVNKYLLRVLLKCRGFESQMLRLVEAKQSAESQVFCWCFSFFPFFPFFLFFFVNTRKLFSERTLEEKQLSTNDKDVTSCSSCSLTTRIFFFFFFSGKEWDALKMFLQPMDIISWHCLLQPLAHCTSNRRPESASDLCTKRLDKAFWTCVEPQCPPTSLLSSFPFCE